MSRYAVMAKAVGSSAGWAAAGAVTLFFGIIGACVGFAAALAPMIGWGWALVAVFGGLALVGLALLMTARAQSRRAGRAIGTAVRRIKRRKAERTEKSRPFMNVIRSAFPASSPLVAGVFALTSLLGVNRAVSLLRWGVLVKEMLTPQHAEPFGDVASTRRWP
ncbi:MAG TPA: hypothetical protein VD971_05780 [Phycisphaerales bacterium]|nr:hypothetical protein [Phycisphaerales bacterium]